MSDKSHGFLLQYCADYSIGPCIDYYFGGGLPLAFNLHLFAIVSSVNAGIKRPYK